MPEKSPQILTQLRKNLNHDLTQKIAANLINIEKDEGGRADVLL